MVREAGVLNERIVQLTRERETLIQEQQSLSELVQKEVHTVKVMQLEQSDLVQLYKETFEDTLRKEKTIEALEFEKSEAVKRINDFRVRVESLQEAEERAVAEARAHEMAVRTLKQQVTDLVGKLEEGSRSVESKIAEAREREQELFVLEDGVTFEILKFFLANPFVR